MTRLQLRIRRCHHDGCVAHKRPYRPEAEGRLALPHHEFGLDVIALVGRLRYAEHRSVSEVRAHLVGRGVAVAERTVTNLLDRYDELLAVALTDDRRLEKVLAGQGKVLLAIDGPPGVAQETDPPGPPDRAGRRGPVRSRGRGGSGVLRGRPQRPHRRRPAAAGRVRAGTAPPVDGDPRQSRAGRGEGGLPPESIPLKGFLDRALAAVGGLGGAVDHFVKVSRSYWPGLEHFQGHCGGPDC